MSSIFPFGGHLNKVIQEDRSPKIAFVLGVYASAVHAKWLNKKGQQVVAALAVASEPEIFWRGEGAEQVIKSIHIPEEAGSLELPNPGLNGPSGRALDDLFLNPLGINRSNTWLCDLIPESRMNPNQQAAIEKFYSPLVKSMGLPAVTIPQFRKSELKVPERRNEILDELFQSKASTLILLGDLPIIHFLNKVSDLNFKGLDSFVESIGEYGQGKEIKIEGKAFEIIPLCHPRQAQRLGTFNKSWFSKHENWINSKKQNW